ncbi:MAG TPA: hypothetical protein VM942_02755 [Acidimicrobiales bacterium]|nr:hypothetical protein [Acidimicrobiales bacterium]
MRMFRRTGAMALSALVVSAFLVAPASAQEVETRPETYLASASARALYLELLGIKVSAGTSGIEISSLPQAKATGGGLLLASGTVSTVETTGPGQVLAPPPACVLNIDPPLLALLGLQAACGEARVNSAVGAPTAFGHGEVLGVTLGGAQLLAILQPILDAVAGLVDPTLATVTNLLDPLLGPVLEPLLGTLDLTTPVASLVDRIGEVTALAEITVGESTSEGTSVPSAITSTATAQGGEIDLLPGLALNGAPLLRIVVGSATATSTFDRGLAKSTPSYDAAIARVTSPLLGLDLPIRLDTPLDLNLGVLRLQVSLGAGRTTVNPDGSVSSEADGVAITLTTPLGVISLQLAHAQSAIGGQGRLVAQRQVVQPVELLAKTGSDPWLPMAGFALLLAAYTTRRLVVARPGGNRQSADR